MTKELSRRLRRARRSEIIPVYYGIKRAVERAIAMRPENITLVSIEKGVWEIFANDIRIGGVMGSYEAVKTAARLVSKKTGCELLEADAYSRTSGVCVAIFQLKLQGITPVVAKIVERRPG